MEIDPPPLRDELLDRIRLHRQADKDAIVIVEGSPDRLVIRDLLEGRHEVFVAGSRSVVVEILDQAIGLGLGPAVAVVDRDFDNFVPLTEERGLPVIAYDGADLESMLWDTGVFPRALDAIAIDSKVKEFGGLDAVRTAADALILPLQRLRAANSRLGLGLDFDSLDLRKRIRAKELALSPAGLCDSLRAGRTDLDRRELISMTEEEPLPKCPLTDVDLVRGKDRMAVLGVLLRRAIGRLTHQEAKEGNISREFYSNCRPALVGERPWLTELKRMVQPPD